MVDEGPHLTKEERRQRQKRLEQARQRRGSCHKAPQGSPVAEPAAAATPPKVPRRHPRQVLAALNAPTSRPLT